MTNQEKKQLKSIMEVIENVQADISIMISQEEDRLDKISDSLSQIERAMKLEENIDNLSEVEERLGDAISAIENII